MNFRGIFIIFGAIIWRISLIFFFFNRFSGAFTTKMCLLKVANVPENQFPGANIVSLEKYIYDTDANPNFLTLRWGTLSPWLTSCHPQACGPVLTLQTSRWPDQDNMSVTCMRVCRTLWLQPVLTSPFWVRPADITQQMHQIYIILFMNAYNKVWLIESVKVSTRVKQRISKVVLQENTTRFF